MPTLMVSTCGTSLLSNAAPPAERHAITQHANARTPQDVPEDQRTILETILQEARHRLDQSTHQPQALEALSAELHAIIRYQTGKPEWHRAVHHILLSSDTWLGEATAQMIQGALEAMNQRAEVRRIRDLRTASLEEFRVAMTELAHFCAHEVARYRSQGYRVVFNLTGGFKSVQGFLQALGMIYADECIYIFERTQEILSLPKLPINLKSLDIVRKYQKVFRRWYAGLPITSSDVDDMPETLLFRIDNEVSLSVWGELVWEEAKTALLQEKIWDPVDPKVCFGPQFVASTQECTPEERAHINERLGDLARFLHDGTNPKRLDFKKLRQPSKGSTHECDAWAHGSAKRIFGHFEGEVFVVDRLDEGLH